MMFTIDCSNCSRRQGRLAAGVVDNELLRLLSKTKKTCGRCCSPAVVQTVLEDKEDWQQVLVTVSC